MKKLFSLVLVLMMITSVFALVGCNGLWGFDEDDDVVTPPGVAWNIKGNVNLTDVDGKSLRAATPITSDYSVLEANAYRLSDGVKMTAASVPVALDGTFTISFTDAAAVGTYTVKITHKTISDFYLIRVVNQTINNNTAPVAVDVTSTAVAEIAAENPAINPVDVDGSKEDDTVKSHIKALEATYLEVVTKGEGQIIAVIGVSLDAATKSLKKTESFTLKATLNPANPTVASVTWASSNPAFATVTPDANDQLTAVVNAVGGGVANITVTTNSGRKTATCVVTVVVPVTGVSLNKSNHTMPDGTTETLVATVAPTDATNKGIAWSSSNDSVAQVVDGVVTAVAPGNATITAASAEDGNIKATCDITVTKVNVDSVNLIDSAVTLTINSTKTLVFEILPANATVKTVSWTSSNPAVAEVNPTTGLITAKTEGSTNVTVASIDDPSKTDVCAVTVSAQQFLVNSISITETLIVGKGAEKTISVTFDPLNATNRSISWTSSNDAVASVNPTTGVVKGISKGTATITATSANGKTDTCAVDVQTGVRTVTFANDVEGLNLDRMQIEILNVPADYTNSVNVNYTKFDDQGVGTPSVTKFRKITIDGVNQFVLSSSDEGPIPSFKTLIFDEEIPFGAEVKIYDGDTEDYPHAVTIPLP